MEKSSHSFIKIFFESFIPMVVAGLFFILITPWFIMLFPIIVILIPLIISIMIYYEKLFTPIYVILLLWILFFILAPMIAQKTIQISLQELLSDAEIFIPIIILLYAPVKRYILNHPKQKQV